MELQSNGAASSVYTLHLFSDNGEGATTSSKTYTVEWSSLLPKRFKRFRVSPRFRTNDGTANNNQHGALLRADIPTSSTLSSVPGGRRRVNLGVADVSGTVGGADAMYFLSTYQIIDFTIEYPTENRFTIELLNPVDLTPQASAPYHLWLLFTPIE